MQELIDKIAHALEALWTPASVVQLLLLAAIGAVTIWIGRRVRHTSQARAIETRTGFLNRIGEGLIIVSPHSVALVLIAISLGILAAFNRSVDILALALKLIALLLMIRVAVYLFRVSVGDHAPVKGWGTTISLIVWAALSLYVLGWLDAVVAALDSIAVVAGATRISVWSVVKLLITVTSFIVVAAWLARWIERRLMSMKAIAISMRIGLAKFVQAFLVVMSILLGLNAAGLDLTTLTVLTGAIGIGLGFGLQSIASNFVSGFVLLMDRSIKP
ncbi:MAG TPA: hypothetical protein VET48_04270, partial [Steroidobacteraceae bacterium]|nr:hypothetical protein [Steroidobacteraceae bacterium]